jgi:hypothetical protein
MRRPTVVLVDPFMLLFFHPSTWRVVFGYGVDDEYVGVLLLLRYRALLFAVTKSRKIFLSLPFRTPPCYDVCRKLSCRRNSCCAFLNFKASSFLVLLVASLLPKQKIFKKSPRRLRSSLKKQSTLTFVTQTRE